MRRTSLAFALFLCLSPRMGASQPPTQSRAVSNQPPHDVGDQKAGPAQSDQRGSDQFPLVVKTLHAPKTEQEAADEKADREDQSAANWWMVRLTGLIALIGIGQGVVFYLQARRLRQTIVKMDEIASGQAADMTKSITEAGKAAAAMQSVAESMATNSQTMTAMFANQRQFWSRQMRAYISVNPGAVIDQDEIPGMRFEAQPTLQNDGLTPAYKVTFVCKTKLLPVPLPDSFDFDLSREDNPETRSVTTINPRGSNFMVSTADSYFSPDEKAEYRKPAGRRIYTWGTVKYKDVNDTDHVTNFCFYTVWGSKNLPVSIRTSRHNDSD